MSQTNGVSPDPVEYLGRSISERIMEGGVKADISPGSAQQIAHAVVKELMEEGNLGMLVKSIVLQVELEHENIRRGGIGPALLWNLRKAGIRISSKDGKIFAGPRESISPEMARLISGFRYELLTELTK